MFFDFLHGKLTTATTTVGTDYISTFQIISTKKIINVSYQKTRNEFNLIWTEN